MKRRSLRHFHPSQGFALIVSIVLMAFLLILLLALSAFTNVETLVSSNKHLEHQARQNALLGFNTAIAQLQKFAGPDQRVSAAADIGTGDNDVPEAKDGTRLWTGVWGNANDPATDLSQAVLLNWLVSGNENIQLTTDPSGRITTQPAAIPAYQPDADTNLGANSTALDAITLNGLPARLLVGHNTAGNTLANYVVAPLSRIQTGSVASGGYAYWIGDEGIKARINLSDPWIESDSANERSRSFANAQRTAGETLFDGLATDESITHLLDPGQILIAVTDLTPASLGQNFPHFTLHSRSVIADPLNGGLKRDLTQILQSSGGSPEETDGRFIFADTGGTTGPSAAPFYTLPPTWGLLRDFASFANAANDPLPLRTPSATRQGIHPILMFSSIAYTYSISAPSATEQEISVYATPLVILWNPYNRKIESGTFEIGFQGPRKNISTGTNQGIVTFILSGEDPSNPAGGSIEQFIHFNLAAANFETTTDTTGKVIPATPASGTARSFLRFQASVPEMEPGAAIYLGLPDGSTSGVYSAGTTALSPRTYDKERLNYSDVARVKIASLTVPKAEDSELSIQMRDLGETSIYLAKANAGGNVSDALNASSEEYYQWIGRIGTDSQYIGPLPGKSGQPGELRTKIIDIASGTGSNPKPMLTIDAFHQLGSVIDDSPVPLPVHWISQANPRAYMIQKTEYEPDGNGSDELTINPVYFAYASSNDAEYTVSSVAGSRRYIVLRNMGTSAAALANNYHNHSYQTEGWHPYPQLFELPAQNDILFSIADLRHAALSAHATSPAYAIGNSLANFRIKDLGDVTRSSAAGGGSEGPLEQELVDLSFLLNRALWDKYFFSTAVKSPTSGTQLPEHLPNARHTYAKDPATLSLDNLTDSAGKQAASHLYIDGGFNVNSTSVEAWKAVLGGLNKLPYDPQSPENPSPSLPTDHPFIFSRFRHPNAGWQSIAPGVTNTRDHWGGYRRLSDSELTDLAQRLVEEIRARGPFLSMSDFVNRSIDTTRHTGHAERYLLKGALQAAIDDEGPLGEEADNRNKRTRINFAASATSTIGGGYHPFYLHPHLFRAPDLDTLTQQYNTKALAGWNTTSLSADNNPFTLHGAFNASYITQADILSAIGASLSARSDTFMIRAYGETVNPTTQEVTARAWCEAIVQRMPDYLNAEADAAWTPPADLNSSLNQNFGRRFNVIAFRWLSADEI